MFSANQTKSQSLIQTNPLSLPYLLLKDPSNESFVAVTALLALAPEILCCFFMIASQESSVSNFGVGGALG